MFLSIFPPGTSHNSSTRFESAAKHFKQMFSAHHPTFLYSHHQFNVDIHSYCPKEWWFDYVSNYLITKSNGHFLFLYHNYCSITGCCWASWNTLHLFLNHNTRSVFFILLQQFPLLWMIILPYADITCCSFSMVGSRPSSLSLFFPGVTSSSLRAVIMAPTDGSWIHVFSTDLFSEL